MSGWGEKKWGQLEPGSARSKRNKPGLSECQMRIMGALENCHNTKTSCMPIDVRTRYIELHGESLEPPGKWEREARALCQMSNIFTVNADGSWALNAWKMRSNGRRAMISGTPVIGESGAQNVATYTKDNI